MLRHFVTNNFVSLYKPPDKVFEPNSALLALTDVQHFVLEMTQAGKVSIVDDLTTATPGNSEPFCLVKLAAADATTGNRDFLVLLVDKELLENNTPSDLASIS